MRFILTGGGTGGHLYPLIAVAKALKEKDSASELIFAGNSAGVEAKLIPQEGFEISFIPSAPFSSNPVKLIKAAFKQSLGVMQALKMISSFKPDGVVSSGGYVSASVAFAAYIKKVPVVLLEQNTLPGKTNRFVARFAKAICASFENSAEYFSPSRTVVTGNPVRKEILSADKERARTFLKIPANNRVLLITGASQGAKSINDAVIKALSLWSGKGMTIIHITGEKKYEDVKVATQEIVTSKELDYRVFPYISNIAQAYAAADLVVCRGGATTIAEITAIGLPAIIIPYPYAAEDHQRRNALCLEKKGAALIIDDAEAGDKLSGHVLSLMEQPSSLDSMSRAAKSLGKPDAINKILKVLTDSVSNFRT